MREGRVHSREQPHHKIYNQSQKQFSGLIRSTNDDLAFQVEKLSFDVSVWFDWWEHPPPHFPWRITVILRKAKRLDLEERFLSAYLKHFYTPFAQSTDLQLYARAEKIGILTISSDDRLIILQTRNSLVQMQLEYDNDVPYALANCRMCGSISVKMPDSDGPVRCADCNAYLGTKLELSELANQFILVKSGQL